MKKITNADPLNIEFKEDKKINPSKIKEKDVKPPPALKGKSIEQAKQKQPKHR